jgi:hypothetical protein
VTTGLSRADPAAIIFNCKLQLPLFKVEHTTSGWSCTLLLGQPCFQSLVTDIAMSGLKHHRAEVRMNLGFDIFRTLEDGTPLWIEQVATFGDGTMHVEKLIRETPGEYFIRDASTGDIVHRSGTNPPV